MEQEELRQRQLKRRRERDTLQYGFEQWKKYFGENKDIEFTYEGFKLKSFQVFRPSRQEDAQLEKKNRGKIYLSAYPATSKKRPKRRTYEDMTDIQLNDNFIRKTRGLVSI